MMTSTRPLLLLLAFALGCAGAAGNSRSTTAAPPASGGADAPTSSTIALDDAEEDEVQSSDSYRALEEDRDEGGSATTEAEAPQSVSGGESVAFDIDDLRAQLDANGEELDRAVRAADCELADEIVSRICDLADRICDVEGEDEDRCEDGRDRCVRARHRVDATCGPMKP